MLALSTGAALLLMSAQARSADTPASVLAPAPAVASAPLADPRYTASNIKLAFNYMDASRDGLISREEAAGFRGVAKNFDKADTDHDNTLSRAEFERAMNYVKSKPR